MNAELFDLLRQAGVETAGSWRDVVMVENYAPIPPLPAHQAPHWHRGFDLAILAGGTPAYFAKCRPAHDAVLQRVAATRAALAGHRPGGVSVPLARFASSGRISVLVSRFLRGPTFGARLRGEELASLQRWIAAILGSNAELGRIALRECDHLRRPMATTTLEAASAGNRAYLEAQGLLDAQGAAALADVMSRAGAVTLLPQHGDLWSHNLFVVDDDVWMIDFEEYGDIQVPLFDDVTLVMAAIAGRSGGGREGLRRLLAPGPEGEAWRTIIRERAAAEGIEPWQLDGVLGFYLTQMAAQIHRRSGLKFVRPHLAALHCAAEEFAAGGRGLLTKGGEIE